MPKTTQLQLGTTGRPGKMAARMELATNPHQQFQVPKPPSTLRATGRRAWRAVWTGGKAWLRPDIDFIVVTELCHLLDEQERYRAALEALPMTERLIYTKSGYVTHHPWVTQLRALNAPIMAHMATCGFTPADRARLGLDNKAAGAGVLAELAQRRERSAAQRETLRGSSDDGRDRLAS